MRATCRAASRRQVIAAVSESKVRARAPSGRPRWRLALPDGTIAFCHQSLVMTTAPKPARPNFGQPRPVAKKQASEASGRVVRKRATSMTAPTTARIDPPGGAVRATTVRLTPRNEAGLRLLNAELSRPINRLVNEAVAEYIESNADTLARKLEGTLAKLEGYRRRDPGFRKAIARFVEAEATLEDDTQGRVVEANAGPAVAMVRETLRGG
jgi:predicted transcriptional regulator